MPNVSAGQLVCAWATTLRRSARGLRQRQVRLQSCEPGCGCAAPAPTGAQAPAGRGGQQGAPPSARCVGPCITGKGSAACKTRRPACHSCSHRSAGAGNPWPGCCTRDRCPTHPSQHAADGHQRASATAVFKACSMNVAASCCAWRYSVDCSGRWRWSSTKAPTRHPEGFRTDGLHALLRLEPWCFTVLNRAARRHCLLWCLLAGAQIEVSPVSGRRAAIASRKSGRSEPDGPKHPQLAGTAAADRQLHCRARRTAADPKSDPRRGRLVLTRY